MIDGIDLGQLLPWVLVFLAVNHEPKVRIVQQRRSWRDMFSRAPRTDP